VGKKVNKAIILAQDFTIQVNITSIEIERRPSVYRVSVGPYDPGYPRGQHVGIPFIA